MSSAVFDPGPRTDMDEALYAEPAFAYLDRSGTREAGKVREVIDSWFSHYPAEHRTDLRSRLRSRNDFDHHAAFFELCLHQLLLNLDYSVTVHPTVPSSTRHPDFLVFGRKGSFYLEATLAALSRAEYAARARMHDVYDALDQIRSTDFMVGLELMGWPRTPPPARHIRTFLSNRLEQCEPDELASALEVHGFSGLPKWPYEHDGWRMTFFPIPKVPEQDEEDGSLRPLGMFFSRGHQHKLGSHLSSGKEQGRSLP